MNVFWNILESLFFNLNDFALFHNLVLFEVFFLLSNFVNNLSKELKNNIQDRLFEFNHTLFENPEKKMD